MLSDESWTDRLDRQWGRLRRQEILLSLCLDEHLDVALMRQDVADSAAEYGASVREAPAPALLQHAANLRRRTL